MKEPIRPCRGFTLIEIVIVIAVVGVLIAVVALPFANFRQRQALENTTNAVVAVLNDARTKTLAALNNTSYSVYLESDKITLFAGTTYSSTATTNESFQYEYPVTGTWSLQGGSNIISFDRLKGTSSQYGTMTLQLPNGTSRTVTITALGTVARN